LDWSDSGRQLVLVSRRSSCPPPFEESLSLLKTTFFGAAALRELAETENDPSPFE
jgi:hypothetical protein